MPGDKKEKGKVGEFLRYCGQFKGAIDSINNFEEKWGKDIKKTINAMNLEGVLDYSKKGFFGDFKDGLEKVFKECFDVPLKEKKRSSQTKEVLEDIIKKIEKSEKIENLKQAFKFGKKKFIRKPRIYYESVKKNFESFGENVQALFKSYDKVFELEYTGRLSKIMNEVKELIQKANSNVDVNKLKKSVSDELEKLEKLSELAKKIEKPGDDMKQALSKADIMMCSNVLKQIDETSGIGTKVDRMISKIFKNLKEIGKYIEDGSINKADTLRNIVSYDLNNASKKCDKMSLHIGSVGTLCFGTANLLREKLGNIESRLGKLDKRLDDYDKHKENIENGISYENGILCISDDVAEIYKGDIQKEWKQNIEQVNFIGGKTKIGKSVFSECGNLKTVNLPSAITEISKNLFEGCSNLEEINNAKSVTKIGYEAFSGCSSLQTIDLSNVKTIGGFAFSKCSSLQTIDIPNVKTIGEGVFSECSSLQKIDLSNVKTIGYEAFYGCSSLQKIDLSNVKTIKQYTFVGCSSLQKIDLSNVKTIGEGVFSECSSLKEIKIPVSVTKIGNYAFDKCTNLKEVTFEGEIPEIGYNAFPAELEKIKCKSEEMMELIKEAIGNTKLKFVKI